MVDRSNQFEKLIQVRVPRAFAAKLDEAAAGRLVNRADYIRIALQDRLKADGIDPATSPARAA